MHGEKGKLTAWFDDKGYGFIRPEKGSADVFLHVKEIAPHQRRPRVGDPVRYDLIGSETDKPKAARVRIDGFAWSLFAVSCAGVLVLLCVYACCAWRHILPFYPAASGYVAMSLITIAAYHRDKHSAIAGTWRISESRLHALELLCGWPGALLAQMHFRHKLKKLRYQVVFWFIVIAHGGLWYAGWSGVRVSDFDIAALFPSSFANDVFERTRATTPGQPAQASQTYKPHFLGRALAWRPFRQTAPDRPPADRAEPAPTPIPGHIRVSMRPRENVSSPPSPQSWASDAPTEPPLDDPSACRSRVNTDTRSRQTVGVVQAISVSRGVLVALPPDIGETGVIDPSKLIVDFHRRFRVGEHVRVAVAGVSMSGSSQTINLLLVEPHMRLTGNQLKRRTP